MAKRKRKKGTGGAFGNKGKKGPAARPPAAIDPAAMARDHAQSMEALSRTLEKQQFQDIHEMKAFLNAHLTGKSLDELLAADRMDVDTPEGRARAELGKIHPSQTPAVRRRHAKLALEHDPENLSAWGELARSYTSPRKFEETCREAIAIGRRTLAHRIRTAESEGLGLWGFPECRPFLGACQGLADLLVGEARLDEAIAMYEEILRWNPGDNQGVRYSLLTARFHQGNWEAAHRLLEAYGDEDSIQWSYGKAWLAFAEAMKEPSLDFRSVDLTEEALGDLSDGPFAAATARLREAIRDYPAGPMFLLDGRCLTGGPLGMVTVGQATEAYDMAREVAGLWMNPPLVGMWLTLAALPVLEEILPGGPLQLMELYRLHRYVESLPWSGQGDPWHLEFSRMASQFRTLALSYGTGDASSREEPESGPEDVAFQLRISLDGIQPEIWRRILVPRDVTLEELHDILQSTMGWEDEHLYQFVLGERIFRPSDPDEDPVDHEGLDTASTFLGELVEREGDRLRYDYDYGDGWTHTVTVERIFRGDELPDQDDPVCLDGARNCPPEDCGGIPGYQAVLAALADAKNPRHQALWEWLGEDYDPEAFDAADVSKELRGILAVW